jgi:putative DNA primase/helicase
MSDTELYSEKPNEINQVNIPDAKPQRPVPLEPVFDAFPEEMQKLRNWVMWKYEYREGQTKPWTKVPYNPHTGGKAMCNLSDTWGTFITAQDKFQKFGSGKGDIAGLGFCLSGDVVGIDLDDCRDPVNGVIEPWALDIIEDINSYTEISPSGKGIRIFARGTVPPGRKKTSKGPGIEIYVSPSWRFLTVTGNRIPTTPCSLQKRSEEIAKLHGELFPPEPAKEPTKAFNPSNSHCGALEGATPTITPTDEEDAVIVATATAQVGEKFSDLWRGLWREAGYTDHSTADLALCNYLAFYVGPDEERIHDLFCESGLYRDKWEEKRGVDTYGNMTVGMALQGRTEFYKWPSTESFNDASLRLEELFEKKSSEHSTKVDAPGTVTAKPEPVTTTTGDGGLQASIDEYNATHKIKEEKVDRRFFEDANDILSLPDPVWLIDDLLMENAFGMIYGMPGSFKTFFALDMALSLAHGMPFLDHFPVNKEIVVAYITPEGTAGLKNRLRGWMEARGVDRLRNVKVNRNAFALTDPVEVEAVVNQLAKTGVKPKILFIDTLARNFGGGDENSTKDMNNFVNNVLELAKGLDLGVVVVHHSGKDSTRGARGSIALTGAVDFSIELSKPETPGATTASVRCRKQKEVEEFQPFTVRAERITHEGQKYPFIALSYHADGVEEKEDESPKKVTVNAIRSVLEMCGRDEEHATFISRIITNMVNAGTMSISTTRRYVNWAIENDYVVKAQTARPAKVYLSTKGLEQVKIWELVSP